MAIQDHSIGDVSNGHTGQLPPMVPGTFFFGNVLQLKKRPIDFLVDAATQYGPVFRLKGPGITATVVAGPEGRELISKDVEIGLHRRGLFHAFSTEAGVDIFGVQGEVHDRLRSLLKLGYSRQVPSQFIREMTETTREYIGSWAPGQEFRLFDIMSDITLHCIMRTITPIDLRHMTKDIVRFGNGVMNVVTRISPSWTLWSPAYKNARNRVYRAVEEVIERHRSGEFAQLPELYMVDAFMNATNPTGDRMTDRDIRGGCCYGLCGTHIYLGRLAGFMMFELLHNNRLLENVLLEIDAASTDGQIDPRLFRRMPYFRGAFFETLRVYPLLPGLPFRAERDIQVNGFTIPQGDLVLITPLPAHFSTDKYSNPFAFEVARCMYPRNEHLNRGAFAPFGMSGRTCLAAGMCELITLTAVAVVLREFTLELTSPSYRMTVAPTPLIAPPDSVPIRVVGPRTPARRVTRDVLLERSDLVAVIEEERGVESIPDIEPVVFDAGTIIIEQGAEPDYFYILVDGNVSILITDEDGDTNVVNALGPGQSFGEIGLLKNVARMATVRADSRVHVLRLDRPTLMQLITDTDMLGDELGGVLQERFMRRVFAAALPRVDQASLDRYASEFVLRGYEDGEIIIRQGDPAEEFYVVAVGRVNVTQESPKGETEQLTELEVGDYFGEIGILNRQPRTATVTASGPVEVLCLNRDRFLDVLSESSGVREDVALTVCRRIFSDIIDESQS